MLPDLEHAPDRRERVGGPEIATADAEMVEVPATGPDRRPAGAARGIRRPPARIGRDPVRVGQFPLKRRAALGVDDAYP